MEAVGRLERTSHADLCLKIAVDRGVSLQKNKLIQKTFVRYTNRKSTERVWDI